MWRSVITQQLQADELAVEMSAQLFSLAPHREAKLYYTTMVQDESRHTEAWLQLIEQAGGDGERDPYLDKMATLVIGSDTLEEKVFLMQVFFERLIIPKFKMIAKATPGHRARDHVPAALDRRRHPSRRRRRLRARAAARASKKTKDKLVKAANELLPDLRRARALASARARLDRRARCARPTSRGSASELDHGVRLANSLGVDVGEVVVPL